MVGEYPAAVGAGGGYVWDEVLEYRVWCHPKEGGDDFYYAYPSYEEAQNQAEYLRNEDETLAEVEDPLVLILQREHLNERSPGEYEHVLTERMTEWPPEFLTRPRRTETTIPDFLSPDAPPNRLDILRGLA
jgi:hypothetical protein